MQSSSRVLGPRLDSASEGDESPGAMNGAMNGAASFAMNGGLNGRFPPTPSNGAQDEAPVPRAGVLLRNRLVRRPGLTLQSSGSGLPVYGPKVLAAEH